MIISCYTVLLNVNPPRFPVCYSVQRLLPAVVLRLGMPSHGTVVFLCEPTGKIGAQISAFIHFHAKKVSALGGSLPICEMKESTSMFQPSLLFAASTSCLPTTRHGQVLVRLSYYLYCYANDKH